MAWMSGEKGRVDRCHIANSGSTACERPMATRLPAAQRKKAAESATLATQRRRRKPPPWVRRFMSELLRRVLP